MIDQHDSIRWAELHNRGGVRCADTIEGLLDAADPARALVVVDPDNPLIPALLCDVALAVRWF